MGTTRPDDIDLPLKPGDFVQTTVQSVGVDGARANPDPWRNVETLDVVQTVGSISLNPGKKIYARVRRVEGDRATLEQERAAYKRHHLPGDSLHVETTDPVRPWICRATTDNLRNLDGIYVIGTGPQTEADVEIAKIKDSTAFTVPERILDEGIVPGTTVTVETTADSTRAKTVDGEYEVELDRWVPVSTELPVEITRVDSPMQGRATDRDAIPGEGDTVSADVRQGEARASLPKSPLDIQLSSPAGATGTAEVRLTAVSQSRLDGTIVSYPSQLPSPGDQVTARAFGGKDTVRWEGDDLLCDLHLEHTLPVSGTVQVRVTDHEKGTYRAALESYRTPSLRSGRSVHARVSKRNRTATATVDSVEIEIELTGDVSQPGEATVRIDEVGARIQGHVEGEIELGTEDPDGPDVDLSDVSKY